VRTLLPSFQTSDSALDLAYLIFSHDPTLGSAAQVYHCELSLIGHPFVLIKLHSAKVAKSNRLKYHHVTRDIMKKTINNRMKL
jgi:hypothetical protein